MKHCKPKQMPKVFHEEKNWSKHKQMKSFSIVFLFSRLVTPQFTAQTNTTHVELQLKFQYRIFCCSFCQSSWTNSDNNFKVSRLWSFNVYDSLRFYPVVFSGDTFEAKE